MGGFESDGNHQFQRQQVDILCVVRKVQPSIAEYVPYKGRWYP